MKKYHLQDQKIPEGFGIYEKCLDVAGISYHKPQAVSFIKSRTKWLELERDTRNKHDKNAIKIFGCSKGFLGTKRRLIGYVPKEVAGKIITKDLWGKLRPRLYKTYLGSEGFAEVEFQILGPKAEQDKWETNEGQDPDFIASIKTLKKEKKNAEAIGLLLQYVDKMERGPRTGGVAPWYYEQLAILYRKEKQYDDEVAILERYEGQPKAPGVGPKKLAERLIKAREIRDKNKG